MLFLLLIASALAKISVDEEWAQFVAKFKKTYTAEEELKRLEIFKLNLKKIEEHNSKDSPYKLGVTQFADLTPFEFTAWVKRGNGGGLVPHSESDVLRKINTKVEASNSSCSSIDWEARGAVTPVKNQGQCGSCWAFSTTGAMEGAYFVKSGKLVSLSEQEFVDCDKVDHGCEGGLMDNAFKWVEGEGGLCSEVDYPYIARKHLFCRKVECKTKYAAVKSYQDVTPKSTSAMEKAVCQQPVAIAIEADQSAFQLYKSGVLTSSDCGTELDHGVLLVGFGTEGSNDYWRVKNSWGTSWGEKGYIRFCRNCNKNSGYGQCGLLKQASYPIL